MIADYPIHPVAFTDVQVNDSFWSPRLTTNREVTIPYCFDKCEETSRIDNFAIAGGLMEGKFKGIYFNDSDVYKIVEGAAYALANQHDAKLDAYLDDLIAKFAAAQEDDGYLYTARTLVQRGDPYKLRGGKERWSDISHGHELYNVGHLYEAAVAHYQATGKRSLLDVALKNANLVCRVFGPDGRPDPPGHQEIEIGLSKLYRVTGERKYLDMAKFFLDARGREINGRKLYGQYSQDHEPVIEQCEAVGHSVRAGYLYTGMADVAALAGDPAYIDAIGRIWDDITSKKLYITGAIGARGGGEAFGEAYELPNRSAYCETCASIANVLLNQRLFLLHGDAKYVDIMERVIYNGFLSGLSMSGDRFFYPNRLESLSGEERAPWFGCACCPSNVCRFMPSIPGYVYAHRGDDLYVNLFIAGSATVAMEEGDVEIEQQTGYPWKGSVRIAISPKKSRAFALRVRVPGWARGEVVPSDLYRFPNDVKETATIRVNDQPVPLTLDKGFASIQRKWSKGDVVELDLPMPVRRVVAHEKVADDVDKVAFQRGPIVYCAEGVDNKSSDGNVVSVVVPDEAELREEFNADLLGGVSVIEAKGYAVQRQLDGSLKRADDVMLTAIPYYARSHRERSQMAVWFARTQSAATPLAAPTIASKSKVTSSPGGKGVTTVNDQLEPKGPKDHGATRLHWWPKKGTTEWVQYDFEQPTKVSRVEVYWFDDTGRGACRIPDSWRLLAKVDGEWREVEATGDYAVERDKFNVTTFKSITTRVLRIELKLQEKWASGLHEWRVY